MPKKQQDNSPESFLWREISRQLDRAGPVLAAQLGPPPESAKLSREQEDGLWTWELTPERIARAQFDPAIAKVIEDVRPRVQQLLAQGAEQEATALLRFPFRERLYSTGRPKIEDQVRYAEQMAKRTGHTEPPPPPMPQQPAEPQSPMEPYPGMQPPDQAPVAAPVGMMPPGQEGV